MPKIDITSPYIYVSFYFLLVFLLGFENGISWGEYDTNIFSYLDIIFIYIICFTVGSFLGRYAPIYKAKDFHELSKFSFIFLWVISIFFLFLKLYKLGDIPFFASDPTIRSTGPSLGGVVDYPVRLISLLGIVSYISFESKKDVIFLAYFALSICINILLMNRAEILLIVFSSIIYTFGRKSIDIKNILIISIIGLLAVSVIIGGLAIYRYGAENINTKHSILELIVWVVHGDLTGALNLGSYVTDRLNQVFLHGSYVLGEFYSIINFGDGVYGADLVRSIYLPDRETAQSIAVPFSYYVDFWVFGVLFFGAASGFIYSYLREGFVKENKIYSVLFIICFFNILMSSRSGNFIITPLYLYYFLALVLLYKRNDSIPVILAKSIFICSFVLSTIVAFIRM